ncbi:MAG: TrkH family potassium uptake protein [Bacteroidales bacterium]|nr:TrkH family potassium uptake protein [Bacteroidales bacterium]
MNPKFISVNIGKALLINALFMFASAGAAMVYNFDSGFTPLLISGIVTVIAGAFPFIFVTSAQRSSLQDMFMTIVLSWLLSFVFGMLPYVLWGGEFTLVNAWFESVSGYTTTGSTILTDIEALPKSLLLWRSSTHFIGGLGVIVFLLLVMPDSSPLKLKLSNIELSSISKDGYRYKAGKTVTVITTVYLCLAIALTICLRLEGMSFFDAVNHSFSTVSTGGFSTKNNSIMHFNSIPIQLTIMFFMTLSAMHFGVIYAVFATRSPKPLRQPVTRYYLCVIAALSLLLMLVLRLEGGYESWGKALLDSSFQAISFLTTTGFGQSDNASWPLLANAILLFAAFHCGCSGSTTGGVKADRIYISLKAISSEFKRRLHPSSVFKTKVGQSFISDDGVSAVFMYIVLYIFVHMVSFMAVLLCGADISDAYSGTLASLGNVGPGIGSLGTMGNYSAMPAAAKIIFSIDMFLGRIEIFPFLAVVSMIFDRQK